MKELPESWCYQFKSKEDIEIIGRWFDERSHVKLYAEKSTVDGWISINICNKCLKFYKQKNEHKI